MIYFCAKKPIFFKLKRNNKKSNIVYIFAISFISGYKRQLDPHSCFCIQSVTVTRGISGNLQKEESEKANNGLMLLWMNFPPRRPFGRELMLYYDSISHLILVSSL